MRLFFLTALTMVAFAANSVLTRLAVDNGHIDPSSFAIVRALGGAVVLSLILSIRGGAFALFNRKRAIGAVSLAAYMAGFSLAYLTLDAGLGALILFGVVQIFMFAHTTATGMRPGNRQITGAAIAFLGLILALWPGAGGKSDVLGAGYMIFAGVGWAIYTISGRQEQDPLAATTANFILCLPVVMIALLGLASKATVAGWGLALLCGGVTSGLGYALWYTVLPQIQRNLAPVVQLSVPVIALLGGAALLGEAITPIVVLATVLVVCGIGLAVTSQSAPARRS